MDRLLGELGMPKDSVAGQGQLEQYLEARGSRMMAMNSRQWRGWCLGDKGGGPSGVSRIELRAELVQPAYADGRLYIRDGIKSTGNLFCVELLP